MVTMHDVLDAQWQMDNAKDGTYIRVWLIQLLMALFLVLFRIIYETSG